MKKLPAKQSKKVRQKHKSFFEELDQALSGYLMALKAVKVPVKVKHNSDMVSRPTSS